MHSVNVDEEAIRAERAALEGEYFGAGDPGGGAADEPPPSKGWERWSQVVGIAGPMVHGLVCPNWQIDPQGAEIMREGVTEQLVAWMPNGIPGIDDLDLESPWLKMAGGLALICAANFDWERFRLRPMKPPPPKPEPDDEQPAAGGADAEPAA